MEEEDDDEIDLNILPFNPDEHLTDCDNNEIDDCSIVTVSSVSNISSSTASRGDESGKASFNILLANARSLLPKIDSLVDSFRNLDLSCAIITESWLRPGIKLEEEIEDFEWVERLKVIHKSRKTRAGRTAGGGVAIVLNTLLSLIHI